jgi:hypothetical protein
MNKVSSALRLAERIVGYASPAWHVGAFLPTLRYGVRPPWEAGSREVLPRVLPAAETALGAESGGSTHELRRTQRFETREGTRSDRYASSETISRTR